MSDMHNEDIEKWAIECSFDELSSDQQRDVIDALGTASAYERMRTSLVAARAELVRTRLSALPDAAIARDLHAALRARHASPRATLLSRVMSLRIPVYQA